MLSHVTGAPREGGNAMSLRDRFLGDIGVLLTVGTLWIGYIQSPYYTGSRPVLSYYYKETNKDKPVKGSYDAETTVVISNSSPYPAEDVCVLVDSTYAVPEISCDVPCSISGSGDERAVNVDMVPCHDKVRLTFRCKYKEPIRTSNRKVYEYWKGAPHVTAVRTIYGDVQRQRDKCKSTKVHGFGFDSFLN
jgi:hypothetical protein